ncbi:MAG: hypothetical protein AAGJ83_06420 [Planctomycetota bacterium]
MSNAFEPQYQEEPVVQSSGSGKGCLWGCLAIVGLFAALVICSGVGIYFFVKGRFDKYTSTEPVELPTVVYDEEELEALRTRMKDFREKVDAGEVPEEDLVLTADDINAMISDNDDFKGKVFVKIENDQVSGEVSFPLDFLPVAKGRYFNGSATFDVSMEGGVLIVTAVDAEVNGEPVPEDFMAGVRRENLAKNLYSDPEQAEFMRQFEDISVEEDKLILRFKRPDPSEEDTDATESDGGAESGSEGSVETDGESVPDESVSSEVGSGA